MKPAPEGDGVSQVLVYSQVLARPVALLRPAVVGDGSEAVGHRKCLRKSRTDGNRQNVHFQKLKY